MFVFYEKKGSRLKKDTTEPVRIDSEVVSLVRAQRHDDDGMGVGKFFEVAAKEKLERRKIKNQDKV